MHKRREEKRPFNEIHLGSEKKGVIDIRNVKSRIYVSVELRIYIMRESIKSTIDPRIHEFHVSKDSILHH